MLTIGGIPYYFYELFASRHALPLHKVQQLVCPVRLAYQPPVSSTFP
jgi:hypothetical protein